MADGTRLALQVAVATTAGDRREEALSVRHGGRPVTLQEIAVEHGGRVHVCETQAGELTVAYRALIDPRPPRIEAVTPAAALVALRPSRYAPADVLEGWAQAELADLPTGPERGRAVGDWVRQRLVYELGSSGPLDSAIDTLEAGRGVCRDFAHLTVTLCRAIGIPARFAAVYAPGLSPMDFHAVAEVGGNGYWEVVDATRLAPRQTLVRIGTGQDAADTAFATTLTGDAELISSSVTAVTNGDLPWDDHQGNVLLS